MNVSTQQSVQIAGIKDSIIILKDGGYRMVLSVSTVNFALKSEQEQNSLIFQYQSFLNSLHFPIQIVMRSKRLDLTPYLQKIATLSQNQENELLKIQTEDYIDFVSKLISLANIMKKNFYVVVGYQPQALQKISFLDKVLNREQTIGILKISEDDFKRNSDELIQRANIIASGLGSMGLHCVQLTTEEVIELFYQIYNPEVSGKERVTAAEDLTSPIIQHTSEKKENKKPEETKAEEQIRIDNSATVTETQQQQAALRQQEMLKESERQMAGVKTPEKTVSSDDKTQTTINNQEDKSNIKNQNAK